MSLMVIYHVLGMFAGAIVLGLGVADAIGPRKPKIGSAAVSGPAIPAVV